MGSPPAASTPAYAPIARRFEEGRARGEACLAEQVGGFEDAGLGGLYGVAHPRREQHQYGVRERGDRHLGLSHADRLDEDQVEPGRVEHPDGLRRRGGQAAQVVRVHVPGQPNGKIADGEERHGGRQCRARNPRRAGMITQQRAHRDDGGVPPDGREMVRRVRISIDKLRQQDIGTGQQQHRGPGMLARTARSEEQQRSAHRGEVQPHLRKQQYQKAGDNGEYYEQVCQHEFLPGVDG